MTGNSADLLLIKYYCARVKIRWPRSNSMVLTGNCCLWACPETICALGFDVVVRVSTPKRWFTCIRLLDPYLTYHMDTPSPSTLTTTVFSQCRSGRFEAGPCRQTPEGHDSSITSMAFHTSRVAPASPFRIATAHANTRAFGLAYTGAA
jgi:hypothetical protein